jgi:hypothetical protein
MVSDNMVAAIGIDGRAAYMSGPSGRRGNTPASGFAMRTCDMVKRARAEGLAVENR